MGGQLGPAGPVLGQALDLGLGGDVASDQEPEETLRQGLTAAGSAGQQLLALGDGVPTEPRNSRILRFTNPFLTVP